MWQQFMIQSMPMALKLPDWMTGSARGFCRRAKISQTGIAWLKTFTAYCLEAFVIALAIKLSFGLFASAALNFTIDSADITVQMMLAIFNLSMPMVATAACVKGADGVVRSCMGLG